MSTFAVASSLLASASAQRLAFSGDAPSVVRPLQESVRVNVSGAGAFSSLDAPRVWVDGRERTSDVDVLLVDSSAIDSDGDGVVDETRAAYDVNVRALDLHVGQLLEVDLGATTAEGARHYRTASRVAPHVEVRVSDHVVFGSEPTQLYVQWDELALDQSAVLVTVGGADVTRLVGIGAPKVVFSDETNGFVVQRIEHYELDLSRLAGRGLDGLPMAVTLYGRTFQGRVTSASASTVGQTGGGVLAAGSLTKCQTDALDRYCKALGLSKNSAGSVSSTATPAQQKQAADDLQNDLIACGEPFPNTTQEYKYGTLVVKFRISQTTSAATINDKADVVVAIGNDGSGTGNGTNASATNTQPGGMAIAVGGDGGAAASSAGNGGNGTASGTCGAGGTPAGGAFGAGGNGGSPTNGTSTGGTGGAGNSTTAPPTTSAGAGGSGGSAGQGGGGGWGNCANNGGTSGHF